MKVHLTYFLPSGKYYSMAQYDTSVAPVPLSWPANRLAPLLCHIFEEVAAWKTARRLPGLVEGHSEFAVLIDVPDHPHRHPHLLPADADLHAAQDVVREVVRTLSLDHEGLVPSHGLRSAMTRHDTTVGPLEMAPERP